MQDQPPPNLLLLRLTGEVAWFKVRIRGIYGYPRSYLLDQPNDMAFSYTILEADTQATNQR
jgi:hypothetical protein